ncbi:MAG: hypothetical protein N3H31_03240 [Candidatus Nezhaarchaeota archaeon]|nr:hypothetical protein [Candidatus Nezhaarchaeota archaeon]
MPEPFMLYVSKRFLDKASKTFSLGFIVRKPLMEILKKMGVPFRELDRDEVKAALDKVAETKGITITVSQLIKSLALAFFLPTGLIMAALKKVHYRSGAETEDSIMLEFLVEIPRAFRPTLFYDIWLIVPKTEDGAENAKRLVKKIVEKTGAPPLLEEEWENLQPVIEKLKGKLEVRGVAENLWATL